MAIQSSESDSKKSLSSSALVQSGEPLAAVLVGGPSLGRSLAWNETSVCGVSSGLSVE
jgi:hypothetical protein